MPGTWSLIWTAEGLVAHGEIDLDAATAFEAQASEAVMLSTVGTFLIDLSGVTFMDSAGLRTLVTLDRATSEDGLYFKVLCGQGHVRRVLRETGLDGVLSVVDRSGAIPASDSPI